MEFDDLFKKQNDLQVWEGPLRWGCTLGPVSSQYPAAAAEMTGGDYKGARPTALTINASASLP